MSRGDQITGSLNVEFPRVLKGRMLQECQRMGKLDRTTWTLKRLLIDYAQKLPPCPRELEERLEAMDEKESAESHNGNNHDTHPSRPRKKPVRA